jgi:hypothetical protein
VVHRSMPLLWTRYALYIPAQVQVAPEALQDERLVQELFPDGPHADVERAKS